MPLAAHRPPPGSEVICASACSGQLSFSSALSGRTSHTQTRADPVCTRRCVSRDHAGRPLWTRARERSSWLWLTCPRRLPRRTVGAKRLGSCGRGRHPAAQRVLEAEAQATTEEEHHHHIGGLQGEPRLSPSPPAPPPPLCPARISLYLLREQGVTRLLLHLCYHSDGSWRPFLEARSQREKAVPGEGDSG